MRPARNATVRATSATGRAAPFFSVLISTYNRRSLVLRALAGVFGQAERDYEIVFVDDGSTDGTLDAVTKLSEASGVGIITRRLSRNSGIPTARNACLGAASGTIAAFLDSDDLWHPGYLSLLRAAFAQPLLPIFAFTDYFSEGPCFSGPVRQFQTSSMEFDPIERMITSPYVHTMSCFAAPIDAIRTVGGFTESLTRFSDLDLYVRLLAGPQGGRLAWWDRRIVNIPQVAVLKTLSLVNRNLSEYRNAWEQGGQEFLDLVFSYPCLHNRLSLRARCEAGLLEGQKRFFANFETAGGR